MRITKPPEQRRAELVAAARHLFDKNGVDNTRVSDIVAHVGVAQGVFYYYFKSKKSMVDAVVEAVSEELAAEADHILGDDGLDFSGRLAGLIRLYIGLVDQFVADGEQSLAHTAGLLQNDTITGRCWRLLTEKLLLLVEQGARQGAVTAQYPQTQAQVALWGLWRVAQDQLPTREEICAVAEQSLGLAPGGLLVYLADTGAQGASQATTMTDKKERDR